MGPAETRTGRGYFAYARAEGDGVDDMLSGEVGLGNDEVGSPWQAIKQRDVQPELEAIGQSRDPDVGGGGWDVK